jgi:hypothetical protein
LWPRIFSVLSSSKAKGESVAFATLARWNRKKVIGDAGLSMIGETDPGAYDDDLEPVEDDVGMWRA